MGSNEFRTICELFLGTIDGRPKADAFLIKSQRQYRSVSSAEALRQVAALAAALDRQGVAPGDRVAIISENRLEWALTDFALLGLGAIGVPIYPTLLEPDVEFILRDSGSVGVVLSTRAQLRKVVSIRPRLPQLGFVLGMDRLEESIRGARGWHEVVEEEAAQGISSIESFRQKAAKVEAQQIATLLYTSGTTGEPKGVVLTHANIVSNVQACRALFDFGPGDVGFSFLPLSHIFERMLDYFCIWAGVSIAYPESMERMPQNLLEVRPTVMAVVPRVLEKIRDRVMETVRQGSPPKRRLFGWAERVCRRRARARLENRSPGALLSMQYAVADRVVCTRVRAALGGRMRMLISGAAPLSPDIAEFFHAMGMPVYEGYGLTETSPVIAVNFPGSIKLGTVGRPIPGVEVKLSDDRVDEDFGAGREILTRGPNVTPGYYQSDESNREAFADGWFRTGDLGSLDVDGYLSITGRKKNLFKTSGGKYVSPEKIESLFQGHPYVAQIVVVGDGRRFVSALIVPHFTRLEAYAREQNIEFRNREELTAQAAIRTYVGQLVDEATRWLAPHEKIRQFTLLGREFSLENGELTPTQKIRRRVVQERCRDVIEKMYSKCSSSPNLPRVVE
ncbi:MAG: long-chain fatty acid--CoA ligase [Terriglobia bacterium]